MLNVAIIQGRLTKEPELRESASGKKYCNIQVACSRGKNDDTDFLNAIAFDKKAEFINQYFNKGDMILIHGRNQSRNYEDKEGNKRTAYDILINEINFCGSKKSEEPDEEVNLPFEI